MRHNQTQYRTGIATASGVSRLAQYCGMRNSYRVHDY